MRRTLGDFKGWVTLRLNFTSKGYVSRQYLWTARCSNDDDDDDDEIAYFTVH